MAIKFLNNIDLNQNQLLNARVHVGTAQPTNSGKGTIWLDSNTGQNVLKFHDGTEFKSVLDNTTIADTIRQVKVDTTNNGTANATLSTSEALQLIGGNAVTLAESGGIVTISSSDTNTQNAYAVSIPASTTKLRLSGSGAAGTTTDDIEFLGSGVITVARTDADTFTISSSAEANVDTDLGKATHASQITITSSTGNNVVVGEATSSIAGVMSTTHHDKLENIEENAKDDQTAPEIRTLLGTGNSNLVPAAPASGSTTKFLRGDGTFQTPAYIANTTTGAQMTESTLRSKLGSITENVTIGDADDVQVTIAGNLVVQGDTTTVSSTNLNLEDHNIILDSNNNTSAVVDGAGITIEGGSGSDATFTYRASTAVKSFELKLGSSYEDLTLDTLHATTLSVTNYGLTASDIPNIGASKINSGEIAIAQGGTGASSASAARTALGLAIGSNVQAYDAQLADVAGLAVTNGGFIVGDGSNFVLESGSTARTSLGLAIGSDVQAYDAQLDTLAGMTSGEINAFAALTATEIAKLDGLTATTTQLNTVDATSSIQTQLNSKQATISAGSGIVVSSNTVSQKKFTASLNSSSSGVTKTASSLTYTVNHALGERGVKVELYETASPYAKVFTEVQHYDANNVRLVFASAPGEGTYTVHVTL